MNWTHLIFEAYCGRKWDIKGVRSKYHYGFDDGKKILNENYNPKDPTYKTPRKPSYCKDEVCLNCWKKDCKHLILDPVDDEDYNAFMDFYRHRIGKDIKQKQK